MDKVKLHRCSWTFLHTDRDACWKVQRHLDEAGIPYEVVKHGYGKSEKSREDAIKRSGQKYLPFIEEADGTVYRAESDDMVERIKAGTLGGAS